MTSFEARTKQDGRGRGAAWRPGLILGASAILVAGLALPGNFVAPPPAALATTPVGSDPAEPADPSGTETKTEVVWDSLPAAESEPEEPADSTDADVLEKHVDDDQVAAGRGEESAIEITPMAIPAPTSTTAVITVKVGGDRAANGTVLPLQGVRLALHGAGTATGGGGGANGVASVVPAQGNVGSAYSAAWSWTRCTSDANGDCSFVIPIRAGSTPSATGVAQDTRFWVVQESAPSGWYTNPSARVGHSSAAPERVWQYRFRTDTQLRAGVTYSSQTPMYWTTTTRATGESCGLDAVDPCYLDWQGTAADPDRGFMRNRLNSNREGWYASNNGRTTGVWAQSRTNPEMIGDCPIDIALIADTSGSLRANNDLPKLQAAMAAFVDAFRGTKTRMALFSFANRSPSVYASNHPTLLPVTTASQATTFKNQWASWADGGGTNWDEGFAAAAADSSPDYDLAILLTDGNPSVIRDNSGVGASAYTSFQDIDAGVFSANSLKAKGTRVIGLGIGAGFTAASEVNLRAVSGTTKGVDYFRAADFDEATEALVELAQQSCTSSIGVQKLIVPEGGTIEDAVPAPAGWEFGASTTATSATVVPATQTTVEGGEGKVEFGLRYAATASSASVRIHEVQQDGYELLPVGAKNAVCVNVNTGTAVTVTNTGDAAKPAFTLNAPENQRIECKVYNKQLPAGEVDVKKTSDPVSGTKVVPGQVVNYTLHFENTGGRPIQVEFDDVLSGVVDDADLITGPVADPPLAASYDSSSKRILISGTLAAQSSADVTYSVRVKDPLPEDADGVLGNFVVKTGEDPPGECEPSEPTCTEHPIVGSLSWSKIDASGTAALLAGSEWTLTPYLQDGTTLNTAGAMIVTDCGALPCPAVGDQDSVAGRFRIDGLAPGTYRLVETKAPAGYQLLQDGIDVTVNSAVNLGGIENKLIEIPGLPFTGGMGEQVYWAAAGVLGAGTIGMGIIRGIRRKGTRADS